MANITVINFIRSDGSVEKKEMPAIEEKDISGYRLLGESIGLNVSYCAQLASKHTNNFWNRVCGYRVTQKLNRPEMAGGVDLGVNSYIAVCFYESPTE